MGSPESSLRDKYLEYADQLCWEKMKMKESPPFFWGSDTLLHFQMKAGLGLISVTEWGAVERFKYFGWLLVTLWEIGFIIHILEKCDPQSTQNTAHLLRLLLYYCRRAFGVSSSFERASAHSCKCSVSFHQCQHPCNCFNFQLDCEDGICKQL